MKFISFIILILLLIVQCKKEHKYFNFETDENEGIKYIVFKDKIEFYLNGIPYGATPNRLEALKGIPNERDTSEIGGYEIVSWKYDGFITEITNNHIYLMRTNSSEYKTPSGISPGLSKTEILRILQIDSMYVQYSNNEWQIPNPEMVTMVFNFDNNEILKELEFGIDLP